MNQIEEQIKMHQKKITEYTNKIILTQNLEEQIQNNNLLKKEQEFLESLLLIKLNLKKEFEKKAHNKSETDSEEKRQTKKNNLENLNLKENIKKKNYIF